MSTRTIHTQAEFDEAAEAGVDVIVIRSESDVQIVVTAHGSSKIGVYGSSAVKVYGLSAVMAFDSSTVAAYNSSTVSAFDSSTVSAFDSSTVKAFGSSTVAAFRSSTVLAYGSSAVKAYGSSAVRAYNSSTVEAHDSTTVEAHESSTVVASKFVTVRLFSDDIALAGNGHVIDATDPDLAALIVSTWDAPPPPVWSSHIWEQLADAILDAGWRPPARTIDTEEELEELPEESLVRDADGVHLTKDCGEWYQLCVQDPDCVRLPATVLWEPGDDDE